VLDGRRLASLGVDVFLGVPFAQPPVAELRWRPPRDTLLPWQGVRDASMV